MSAASMFGQSIALGTTVGEGEIYFSDGTVQTTAYNPSNITVDYLTVNETATINTLNTTVTATINTLDVTETATIETAYIGSNSSTSGLVVYGNVSQVLPDSSSCQYGANNQSGDITGTANTSFGQTCMNNVTSGSQNCGMGNSALANCTTGTYNTAIGSGSMPTLTTGTGNTSLGADSALSISSGSYNTCIGVNSDSQYANSTAIGYNSTVTANNQVMLGTSAETVVIPGNLIIDGLVSQVLSSTQSTQFGSNSLPSNTGPNNTAVGYNCMANNTSGGYNTGMGDYALTTNSTGNYNTGIGHFSQIYGTGEFNTAVGASSLQGTTGSTTGSYNTGIGFGACSSITSGQNNTALGAYSNSGTTTASNTTAIGAYANCNNYTESTSIGYNATNTANNQIMLGTSAETVVIPGTSLTVNGKINQSLVNYSSTQLGTNALLNLASEGGSNTAVGVNSGYYTSSGYNNSSLGANSMQLNSTGSNNTCIGYNAMVNGSTGSGNTSIGSLAGSSITNGTNNTLIGINSNSGYSYSTAIGYNSTTTANNQVMLGTSAETVVIPASCTIGSSSTNISTFNATPNFVNGFQCAGGNSHKLYMGLAAWTGNYTSTYDVQNGTNLNPVVLNGGTSYGSYTLDQSISGIVGCFINPGVSTVSIDGSGALYPFVTAWYFNQISDTQINVAWANLGTYYEGIPTQIQYIAFV
jgi:hypothetical protein